jgi:type I restriction enzyme S subunit
MKDVFFDLNQSPNEWVRAELGKIVEVYGGFAAPKEDEAFDDGVIPFVRMQDLGRYHKTTNLVATKDRLSSNYVRQHKLRVIPKGSILIPRSGSVSLNHRAILGTDACIVSHISALVPKISEVDVRFLYYALCNFDMRTIMKKTTGLDAITFQDVKRIMIPLPSLNEQRRIVAILESADTLRQKREQANLMANKILQAVFRQIFGDVFSNENYPIKTIREVAEKVSDGPFGSNLKTAHYTLQGVRVVRLQNIGVGEFLDSDKVFISLEHYSKLRKHTCLPGDVIVGTLGAPNLRACILPDYVKLAINKADCIQIRPNKSFVNAEYLCHLLNTPQTLHQASSYIHGETRTRISMSQVASLPIPIPPLAVQNIYAQIVNRFDHMSANQERSSEIINELFQSLTYKAFKGELA